MERVWIEVAFTRERDNKSSNGFLESFNTDLYYTYSFLIGILRPKEIIVFY